MAGQRHPRLLSLILLVLTLGAGFLIGWAWTASRAEPAEQVVEGDRDRGGEADRRRLVIDEVGLEPERRARVDGIIQHYRVQMRALDEEFRQDYEPRQRALVRSARDSIMAVLSPEQQAQYDSLLTVRYRSPDSGREGRGDRRGGRGGGRGG